MRRLAGVLGLLLLGCRGPEDLADLPPAPIPRATRGYIVISIDTLRADHLGSYGYGRPTSPFLDSAALAKYETIVFESTVGHNPGPLNVDVERPNFEAYMQAMSRLDQVAERSITDMGRVG